MVRGPEQLSRRRLSGWLHGRPGVRLGALLALPTAWLVVAYLGALFALFLTALWTVDDFTGAVVRAWNLDNLREVVSDHVYRRLAVKTIGIALAVTLLDVVLAFPVAFYMAKVATPRMRRLLVIAFLTPLWASYLVKAYAWRGMLRQGGVLEWLHLPNPGFGQTAVVLVLGYLWLPYMVLPIYAGLERLPDSLLEASADLGGRAGRTFRSVVLPMAVPAVVAGSIFTFSLSLGDYIAVGIVGGKTQMLGNVIYANVAGSANLPFGAALATVPVVVILVYLAAVRRTGALREL